jgi:hypothetical protein
MPRAGEACEWGGAPCFDSVCDMTTNRCHLGAAGDWPCAVDADCQPGLTCVSALLGGVCAAP